MRSGIEIVSALICLALMSACSAGHSYRDGSVSYPQTAREVEGDFGAESKVYSFDDSPIGDVMVETPVEPLAVAVASGRNDSAQTAADKRPPDGNDRVILYSADLGLYVFDPPKSLAKAIDYTKEEGGYMQASTNQSVTLRVPVARFEALMDRLDELGDIHYRNITGTDVTEDFLDLTIRLKNAQALRERLALLFAQAKSVEDSLAIEKELARVTTEIEQMKGRLRYLRDRADFSVITLKVEPKSTEQVVRDHIPLPFGWLQKYGLSEVLQ